MWASRIRVVSAPSGAGPSPASHSDTATSLEPTVAATCSSPRVDTRSAQHVARARSPGHLLSSGGRPGRLFCTLRCSAQGRWSLVVSGASNGGRVGCLSQPSDACRCACPRCAPGPYRDAASGVLRSRRVRVGRGTQCRGLFVISGCLGVRLFWSRQLPRLPCSSRAPVRPQPPVARQSHAVPREVPIRTGR